MSGGRSAEAIRVHASPSSDHQAADPVGDPSGPVWPTARKPAADAAIATTRASADVADATRALVHRLPSEENQKRADGEAFEAPVQPPATKTALPEDLDVTSAPASAAACSGMTSDGAALPDAGGSGDSVHARPSLDVHDAASVPWRPTATRRPPETATAASGVSSAAGRSATRAQRRPSVDVHAAARNPG